MKIFASPGRHGYSDHSLTNYLPGGLYILIGLSFLLPAQSRLNRRVPHGGFIMLALIGLMALTWYYLQSLNPPPFSTR